MNSSSTDLLRRDAAGIAHIVPLSGGHDSTCLAFRLREEEPRPYNYVMTPTGNELPELFEFVRWLGTDNALGHRVIPIMEGRGLLDYSRYQKMIPNFHKRHCTRGLKIWPLARWMAERAEDGPIVLYIGLRADEPAREGALYPSLPNVSQRFPLREWGMDDPDVLAWLEQRNILSLMPERTDCALCFHQQIGEWWRLWHEFPDLFAEGVAFEEEMGGSFRTPKMKDGEPVYSTRYGHTFLACARDTWPCRLTDLGIVFANGHVPTVGRDPRVRDLFRSSGACRACTL